MVRRFVKKSYEDRRYSTKDKTRLEQDINLIRWFAVFIKCALELEGRSFEIQDEVHKVRFNKNHSSI